MATSPNPTITGEDQHVETLYTAVNQNITGEPSTTLNANSGNLRSSGPTEVETGNLDEA